jgi:hypothetical protein
MSVRRADLLDEIDTVLSGSGDYTGDWIDTASVFRVRVMYTFNVAPAPQVLIDESMDQNAILGSSQVKPDAPELPLTARYIRVRVAGGGSGAAFRASVRAVA